MEDVTAVPAVARPARLRTDVFLTFGGKALTLLIGLAVVVLVARELGPAGQGLFAVAYSLTAVLAHLGGLGLTTANPYFVARESEARPRIVANSLWLAAGLGLVLVGVGVVLKAFAPETVEGLGWTPLLVTLAGVPAALAAPFLQNVLLGEGRLRAYNAVEVVHAGIVLAALAVAFSLGGRLTAAITILSAARYGAALVYLVLLGRPPLWPSLALARRMLAYGFRAYVAVVVSFLVVRLDLLLVNGYLGAREAGLYSIAVAIADAMVLVPTVIGLNLFPRVARSGESAETARVFRSIAVLYGLFCLATIPLAGPGIDLVFGDRFDGAVSLYLWLLPGIYSLGLLTILAHHFAGRGYPTEAAAVWFVGLAVNVAINLAFLPGRGAWVASLASSVAYALLLALHMRLFAREAGGYGELRPRPREVVGFVKTAFGPG